MKNKAANKALFQTAHIPLRVCLKLAFKNIWKKKFRFLVIIIICCISLTFLSFTIELNGDKLRQNVYTMIENGYNYTTVKKANPITNNTNKSFYDKYNSEELEINSYKTIKNEIPNLIVHKYENIDYDYAKKDSDFSTSFFTGHVETLIEYDKNNSYELIAGRLPNEDEKEILITDYLVAAFNYFNTFFEDGTAYDYLNKYIDLTINDDYKIVGVVKTNFINWYSNTGFQNVDIDYTDKTNYSFYNDYKMMNAIIIPSKYFEVEKVDVSGNLTFTNNDANRASWLINTNNNSFINSFIPNKLVFRTSSSIYSKSNRYSTYYFGTKPQNNNEIAIPSTWLYELFNIDINYISYADWENIVRNANLTIALTPSHQNSSYSKTFKIVGITTSTDSALITEDTYNTLLNYTQESERIMVQLPTSGSEAYSLFNSAYKKGYVINVWEYHTDIDSYTVDPFIDILSKAGLIVFVAFTIGIMWTIITIEIVDSKKEIGILRSIGLSGIKVSFIFIIQSFFVTIVAYLFANIFANVLIQFYNSGITDSLNVISLYMYTMTYRTPLYLLAFIIIITLISTCIPLYKIMSQKIIDVINERE